MPTSEPPERRPVRRRAARAFLLTPDHQVLLMQIRTPDGARLWIAPGGGIDGEETTEAALLRELEEEVGLKDVPLGALIWRRDHTLTGANGGSRKRRPSMSCISMSSSR